MLRPCGQCGTPAVATVCPRCLNREHGMPRDLLSWSGTPPTVTTKPGRITTLELSNRSSGTDIFGWVAAGEVGFVGLAASYSIRQSTTDIVTEANWSAATTVITDQVATVAGGSLDSVDIPTVTPRFTAIRYKDHAGNQGDISNTISA